MKNLLFFCFGIILILGGAPTSQSEDRLEVFKEEELLQLFKDEKYIIVLLSK